MAPASIEKMVLAAAGLFVDHKKGEIPELKNLLRDSSIDKVASRAWFCSMLDVNFD